MLGWLQVSVPVRIIHFNWQKLNGRNFLVPASSSMMPSMYVKYNGSSVQFFPAVGQADNVSSIFYCSLNGGRSVQTYNATTMQDTNSGFS